MAEAGDVGRNSGPPRIAPHGEPSGGLREDANPPYGLPLGALPESIRQLVELIGWAPTLKLMDALGGSTLYVPTPPCLDADHILVVLLGMESAILIAERIQGGNLHVAKGCAAVRAARNAEIVHAFYVEGVSVRTLALRYRLDERQIYNVVNRTRLDAAALQDDLFGTA